VLVVGVVGVVVGVGGVVGVLLPPLTDPTLYEVVVVGVVVVGVVVAVVYPYFLDIFALLLLFMRFFRIKSEVVPKKVVFCNCCIDRPLIDGLHSKNTADSSIAWGIFTILYMCVYINIYGLF
jgi:hypothetical protein